MEVICLDQGVGQAFLETANAASLYDLDLSTTKVERFIGTQPIPWKHFDELWRVSAFMRSDDSPHTDWQRYESRRIWWRTVPELLKCNESG